MEITKEYLEQQYGLGLTQYQIANALNCSQGLISQYSVKYNIEPPKRPDKNRVDLAGEKIGKLTVIQYEYTFKKTTYWTCVCDCGSEKIINGKHLKTAKIQSCGCMRQRPSSRRTGYMEIPGHYIAELRKKAQKRGLEFSVTPGEMWEQLLKQDKTCALSGEKIGFPVNQNNKHRSCKTASLDRIDSTIGYTKDNIQWVHKHLNIMKQDLSDSAFVEWCKKVADFKRSL